MLKHTLVFGAFVLASAPTFAQSGTTAPSGQPSANMSQPNGTGSASMAASTIVTKPDHHHTGKAKAPTSDAAAPSGTYGNNQQGAAGAMSNGKTVDPH